MGFGEMGFGETGRHPNKGIIKGLYVSSRLLKPFMRYSSNKICPDE